MPIFCDSEINQLKQVIVHRPDSGIARITPKKSEDLLFDDIVHLPQMQAEHDVFTSVLRGLIGESNVMYAYNLLKEAIDSNSEKKAELIKMIVEYEELPIATIQLFNETLTTPELVEVLITGYWEKEDRIYFEPIPNFIFTRDIAVTIKDHVIITRAAKEARFRENILTRFIFWAHPYFGTLYDQQKIINLNLIEQFPPSRWGEKVCIEGGDVMMFDPQYVLVGCSERTTDHAFHALKKVIFEKKIVENVVQVNIPSERSFMHIDTIFTRIDKDFTVVYKPIIYDGLGSYVTVFRSDGTQKVYYNVKDFILAEINPNMKFIFSGNGISPYQEREQWTDGCNLVALKPGVAITYDRNPKTEKAFVQNGFAIRSALDILKDIEENGLTLEMLEKTIITIPSSELCRARGGSHCMTCPINREG